MDDIWRRRACERSDRFAMMELSRVVIGAIRNQHDAGGRSRRELGAHAVPTRGRGLRVDRKMRSELIAVAR